MKMKDVQVVGEKPNSNHFPHSKSERLACPGHQKVFHFSQNLTPLRKLLTISNDKHVLEDKVTRVCVT
jgi:hypothetical protein